MSGDGKSSWVVKSSSESKPWGNETVWSSPHTVCVKTLKLQKGKRNSFKYNKLKDELLICATGKIIAYHGDESLIQNNTGDLRKSVVEEGMALAVQSGCPYRLEAVEDSIILEVSTNRLHASEVCRLHDDYARKTEQVSDYVQEVISKWFLT